MTSEADRVERTRPGRRVVLLGASNLTRGFKTVVGLARERLGAPLEVLAALGHGRSYGTEASFLFRSLPGIERCGLWERLDAGSGRLDALVTDVGNDVAYGVAPEVVGSWVATALDRLEAAGARPVLTGLPLFELEQLDPLWFRFWSNLLFPGRGLEQARVLDAARAVDERLAREAAARGLPLVRPQPAWFGSDPIHYARPRRRQAWSTILASWRDPESASGSAPGAEEEPGPRGGAEPPLLWAPAAADYRRFGVRRTRNQPARRLADGTTLSMY